MLSWISSAKKKAEKGPGFGHMDVAVDESLTGVGLRGEEGGQQGGSVRVEVWL